MEKATFTGGLNKSHIDALLLGNSSKHMGNLTATIINATHSKIQSNEQRKQNLLKGFLSVLTVCFLSGFAGICLVSYRGNTLLHFTGVYIEKILKKSKELSIWMQNIQLAMMAIPISLCVIAVKEIFLEKFATFYSSKMVGKCLRGASCKASTCLSGGLFRFNVI